jgi:hypothetical protein
MKGRGGGGGPFIRVPLDAVLASILASRKLKYARLLPPPSARVEWTLGPDVARALELHTESLALRLMHKASLFAMYRVKAESEEAFRKARVKITAEDVALAWETMGGGK